MFLYLYFLKDTKQMVSQPQISREEISALAYEISQKCHVYNKLCWRLAEATLKLERGDSFSGEDTRILAEQIHSQHLDSQILHWLIAEKTLLARAKYGEIKSPELI